MTLEAVEAALAKCRATMTKCDECRAALEAAKTALDAAAAEWAVSKEALVKAANEL